MPRFLSLLIALGLSERLYLPPKPQPRFVPPSMTRRLLFSSLLIPSGTMLSITAMEKTNVAKIHGRIQWVNSFPDYKVKIVDAFANLHVRLVTSFPDDPGEWQIVDSFPDFKIQIVAVFFFGQLE